jgi:outer membrane protein assembly factor BamD (BamD/ComL family)
MVVNSTRRTGAMALLLVGLAGCSWPRLDFLRPAPPPVPPTQTFVLRGDNLVQETMPAATPQRAVAELSAARDHFRREEYSKARPLFQSLAEDDRNPPSVIQEGMYYQAECLRLEGYYPEAADLYSALLNKHPNCVYREQAVQHLYDIANFWLDDTRKSMQEEVERREGKRWLVWPRFISFDKAKPLLDREGRAIEKLEQVRLHDINGPLADQALFLCGVVRMYHEDYRDADHYFSQIHARHPESKLAPRAIELAVFCKQMSTGGSDYDGRKAAEARKLIQAAFTSYPELANDPKKREFLSRQIKTIDLQQAEKDFNMAEFYRRTGHPGSAYFYYQLVRRRYPNTEFAQRAAERWDSLRSQLEKQQNPNIQLPTDKAGGATPSAGQTPPATLNAPVRAAQTPSR